MIFLGVVGGVIIVAMVLATWYDHRAKRRGLRGGIYVKELSSNKASTTLRR